MSLQCDVRTYSMTLRTTATYKSVLVMANISTLVVDELLKGSSSAA